jgi:hypothetical protein
MERTFRQNQTVLPMRLDAAWPQTVRAGYLCAGGGAGGVTAPGASTTG